MGLGWVLFLLCAMKPEHFYHILCKSEGVFGFSFLRKEGAHFAPYGYPSPDLKECLEKNFYLLLVAQKQQV